MIGIVLVSHSFELANGAVALSRTMAGGEVRIAGAGGLDSPDKELGTDPMLILQAIEEVYSPDGVLVFVDMGSALLSTEFAIQMLDEEKQAKVLISDAPFIEGAVTAAVQARMNSPLSVVLTELKTALLPKQEQLGTLDEAEAVQPAKATEPSEQTEESFSEPSNAPVELLSFTISNTYGIHARPAAKIVELAAKYPHLNISIEKKGSNKKAVNALSLNSIALLGIKKDDTIEFKIAGENSAEFCKELTALANIKFGDKDPDISDKENKDNQKNGNIKAGTTYKEETDSKVNKPEVDKSELAGLIGSKGIAQGAARILKKTRITVSDSVSNIKDPEAEWKFFSDTSEAQINELNLLADKLKKKNKPDSAEIFYAHILILQDPMLKERIKTAIFEEKKAAAFVWAKEMAKLKQSYLESESDYMKERANDIDELEQMLLVKLLSRETSPFEQVEVPVLKEGVLIAEDLSPSQTAKLDTSLIKGICTAKGSPTSHTAILARSLGIPALLGMGKQVLKIKEDTPLILDAQTDIQKGRLYIDPPQKTRDAYSQLQKEEAEEEAGAEKGKNKPTVLRTGKTVLVEGNAGSAKVASLAYKNGADGIGLLRTEFLFLNRTAAPDEEEQYSVYSEIAKIMAGKPVIIRTIDVGGDKELPYLNLQKDENPFLGYRAIRMCLAEPEFFRTQLRAIIRVAQNYPIKIMFPMISSLEELRQAKEQLELAYNELAEKKPDKKGLPVGMMMEVPSAALQAREFAKEVDFFSIGTNDLTQYTLAVERGNSKIASLYSTFNPAVLELIKNIIDAAHSQNIEAGVCGEFASDFEGAKLLCQFGVDSLSVSPPLIPRLKEYLRKI